MTQALIRPERILAPLTKPIKGTLLDAVQMDPRGVPWQDTSGMFESFNCINADYVATLPCPANTLAAPVQAASGTATTGGTLAAGTYRAKITAINTRGETVASNEISQTTTGSTSTVTWNWAAVTGATGYRIYVTNAAVNTETFLVAVGTVTTYVWTGTPAYSSTAASPPSSNTAVVPVTKSFDGPTWNDGFKFATQAGIICKAVGFDIPDAESQLERVFANAESTAVARALMQNRFVVNGSHWAAPTDLTPGAGAVDPTVGLAILEEDAMQNYAGSPIVHAPRSIGSLLTKTGMIHLEGNMLVSNLETRVSADAGYGQAYKTSGTYVNNGPGGTVPTAGELWMYVTGEVYLAGSESVQKGGIDLVETTDSNRYRILRERQYIAAVDCYAAAVRVKVQ